MSWSNPQAVLTASGSGNSTTNTYGANTTAGSLLICHLVINGTSLAGLAVSDSVHGAWTIDQQAVNTTQMCDVIAHVYNPTGGAKPVVTGAATAAGGFIELNIAEFLFAGATGYSFDVGHAATGTGTAVNTGSSGTPTGATDLGIAGAAPQGSISSGTSGWTFTKSPNGSGFQYLILSSASAETATFTAASGNTQWAATLALFNPITAQNITATGIASVAALGNPSFSPGAVTISPTGIGSLAALGNPIIVGLATISATGIASVAALGNPSFVSGASIAPIGIGSNVALGLPTVVGSASSITVTGIAPTTALGNPAIFSGFSVVGIAASAALGTPTLSGTTQALTVAPYAGQNQQQQIQVPATIAYKSYQYSPEEGPWVMPPYASIYPPPPPPEWPPPPALSLWNRQSIFAGTQWSETTHND